GYNLHGLAEAQDGCLVCPECGAAWRTIKMIRREPFVPGATLGDPVKLLTDAGGRVAVLARDDAGKEVLIPRTLIAGRESAELLCDDPAALSRARSRIAKDKRRESLGSFFGVAAILATTGFAGIASKVIVDGKPFADYLWHTLGLATVVVGALILQRLFLWA